MNYSVWLCALTMWHFSKMIIAPEEAINTTLR